MATTPTSIVNRLMGLEAFTDALSLPAGTTIGGATVDSASRVVNTTATSLTVTAALHANKLITLNRATGTANTLPAATGTGNVYTFLVVTPLSGGSHTFVRVGSDAMTGLSTIGKAAGGTSTFATTNATTITLNATTTGGLGGDYIQLTDVAAGSWFVEVDQFGSGTLATPFT